jgi:hypothetical protein
MAKERFSEKKQKMLSDRWKDPEFRARHAAAINRRLREEAQAIVAALEKRTGRRAA